MKKSLKVSVLVLGLAVCACSSEESISSYGLANEVFRVEVETTPETSQESSVSVPSQTESHAGAGDGGSMPSGDPHKTPSSPDYSADNEVSPPYPAPGMNDEDSSSEDRSERQCVPPNKFDFDSALVEIRVARLRGKERFHPVKTIALRDADLQAEMEDIVVPLAAIKKQMTGYGNLALQVVLCDDANKNGKCDVGSESQMVVLSIRGSKFVSARYPARLGNFLLNLCEMQPKPVHLVASVVTTHHRLRFSAKSGKVELDLKF